MSTTQEVPVTAPQDTSPHTTHAPIPFTRILGVELRKMFDTRSGFWLMASIAILAVIATAATIIFSPSETLTYGNFAGAIGTPMAVILPIVAILSVTSEWSQRSALTTFTLVPNRQRVISAKLLLTVAIGAASMVLALTVGAVGNLIGTAIAGVDPTWEVSVREVAQIILANEIGVLIGFMLGVLLRSSAGAIVGYFVYSLVLPTISGALASTQQWYADNAGWIDLNWTTFQLFDSTLSRTEWTQLGVASTIWLVIPLTVGLILVRRSEVK
ncbi:MAG: ABC transporter permease [Nocardioides sp.]|nr:ABC transporter permease [Nocardioides sp.]